MCNNALYKNNGIKMTEEKYLPAIKACEFLNIPLNAFNNLVRRGEIPKPVLINGKKLWPLELLKGLK